MKKLIKALKNKGHINLAKKVLSKIKMDRVPYDHKDVLVQQLKDANIYLPNTNLETLVQDLLVSTTPRTYSRFVKYVIDHYSVDDTTAKKIIDIVRRGSELDENFS